MRPYVARLNDRLLHWRGSAQRLLPGVVLRAANQNPSIASGNHTIIQRSCQKSGHMRRFLTDARCGDMLRFTGIFGEFVIFPTSVSPSASHLLPREKALTECKPQADKRSFIIAAGIPHLKWFDSLLFQKTKAPARGASGYRSRLPLPRGQRLVATSF